MPENDRYISRKNCWISGANPSKLSSQIREIFKSVQQETRSLCGVEEFEESMDSMHEANQVDENFDSDLLNI